MATIPQDYVFACSVHDLPARGKKIVHLGGKDVLIIVCDTGLYAVEDRCPQTGRPISHGAVLNCVITLPTNGAKYDLRTGKYIGGGQSPLQSHWLSVFQLRVFDDQVYIRLPQAARSSP